MTKRKRLGLVAAVVAVVGAIAGISIVYRPRPVWPPIGGITTTTTTVAPTRTTTVASGSPQPVGGDAGPWNVVFDSEFNGSSLDTSQWSTGWFGSGVTVGVNRLEQECMGPGQVSVANGALDLTAVAKEETCGGVTRSYASGMVTTDRLFSFTYGYMEARIGFLARRASRTGRRSGLSASPGPPAAKSTLSKGSTARPAPTSSVRWAATATGRVPRGPSRADGTPSPPTGSPGRSPTTTTGPRFIATP